MKSAEVLKLVASVVVCQLAGIIGSVFTASSVSTWYAALRKPSFTPPGWLFGPVWISLYALMGVAAYLVWRNGLNQREVRIALSLFVAQLILNALWSATFFGFRSPLAGLVDISALWVLIVLTIFYFLRVSATAGLLLVPYIVWVSFAAVLNYYIWAMNT